MIIELGVCGYISFKSYLEPGKLIILCMTESLDPIAAKDSNEKIEPLLPVTHYGGSDPMKMPVPGFCVHPFKNPTGQEPTYSEWVWFAATPDGGVWEICLTQWRHENQEVHWESQFIFYPDIDSDVETAVSNCNLLDYESCHAHEKEEVEVPGKPKLSIVN